MNNDLVATVRHCFTNEVVDHLSAQVGETKLRVEEALSKAVPSVLDGLLRQAEQGTSPETLLHLVRDADAAEVLAHLAPTSGFPRTEQGADLLNLLGDAYPTAVHRIAEEARIQPAASGTLLQTAATAALGVLGKFAVENDLTPPEFVRWLQSQRGAAGASTPPPPSLRSPLVPNTHLATTGPAATRQSALAPPRPAMPPARMAELNRENRMALAATSVAGAGGAKPWQLSWLLLAVTLGYFLGRDHLNRTMALAAQPVAASLPVAALPTPAPAATAPAEAPEAPVAMPAAGSVAPAAPAAAPTPKAPIVASMPAVVLPPAPAAPGTRPRTERPASEARPASLASAGRYDPARDVYVHDIGRPTVLTLANGGGTANVGASSTEARLYGILTAFTQADSVSQASAWVDFDQVYFEPGQTTLTPESMRQLTNIARILKTFPDVVVKIGGYTDSTGVGPEDLRFSEARARSVMTVLANQGVRLYRLFAQGYGAKYAVAPNTTPASRALNRRVSIRVLRKQS